MKTTVQSNGGVVPCVETEILKLFRVWEVTYKKGNESALANPPNETDADEKIIIEEAIEAQRVSMPATSAQDVAAQVLAATAYGSFAMSENHPLIRTMMGLVGSAQTLPWSKAKTPAVSIVEIEDALSKARSLNHGVWMATHSIIDRDKSNALAWLCEAVSEEMDKVCDLVQELRESCE